MKSTLLWVMTLIFCLSTTKAKAQEVPFSVNDLAILFPLDLKTTLPKFQVSLNHPTWKILSSKNFSRVIEAAKKSGVYLEEKLMNPAKWFLVGIRYSPCTIFAGRKLPCTEQIRFVFQPHNIIRNMGFEDYSMHVVFNFNDSLVPTKTQRLESFRKIKNNFSGQLANKTLKPHPVLDSASGSRYFLDLQQEIILKYIATRSASVVTFMGLGIDPTTGQDNPHDWRFFAGNVDGQGVWNISNLPNGHAGTMEQLLISDETGEFLSNLKPVRGQDQVLEGQLETIEKSALNILDMRKTNDHNVSCVNCHLADIQVFPVMIDDSKVGKARFINNVLGMMKGRARVTETVINNDIHVGRNASEFPIPRIFGYLDAKANISQRMVLDMATSVEHANHLLKLSETPQCSKESQRKMFVECLYFTSQMNVSQCLQKACF